MSATAAWSRRVQFAARTCSAVKISAPTIAAVETRLRMEPRSSWAMVAYLPTRNSRSRASINKHSKNSSPAAENLGRINDGNYGHRRFRERDLSLVANQFPEERNQHH